MKERIFLLRIEEKENRKEESVDCIVKTSAFCNFWGAQFLQKLMELLTNERIGWMNSNVRRSERTNMYVLLKNRTWFVFDVLVLGLGLDNAASLFCCLWQVKAVQSPLTNTIPPTCSWIRAFGRYLCIDHTLTISSSYGKIWHFCILEFCPKAGDAIGVRRFSTHGLAVTKLWLYWKNQQFWSFCAYLDMIFYIETFGCSRKVWDDSMELEINFIEAHIDWFVPKRPIWQLNCGMLLEACIGLIVYFSCNLGSSLHEPCLSNFQSSFSFSWFFTF